MFAGPMERDRGGGMRTIKTAETNKYVKGK
jgi:hypothetical protein